MIYQMKAENNWCLYRHITPSGKVYIGITSQKPEYRWNHGKGYLKLNKTKFKSSIIKYGWDNIKHEVLFSGLKENTAKRLEIELIRHYKNLGISLNHTDGGEGARGVVPWNKGIKVPYEKSNKLKGKKLSEEHKKKLSIAHKGKASRKGFHLSPAQIELLRRINTGRKKSLEEKERISKAFSKPVALIDSSGNIVKRYSSATKAAIELGIDISYLNRCCRQSKLCKGYRFIRILESR